MKRLLITLMLISPFSFADWLGVYGVKREVSDAYKKGL
jgi:hypothetical protein